MKIWIRIGVKQEGLQPPRCRASVDAKVQLLHPRQFSGTRLLPAPSASPQTALATRKPRENGRFLQSGCTSSNWHRPENRSYRKQVIKPCLTGARMQFSDFGFLALCTERFGHEQSRPKTT